MEFKTLCIMLMFLCFVASPMIGATHADAADLDHSVCHGVAGWKGDEEDEDEGGDDEINIWDEIVDMPAIIDSGIDVWKDFNEDTGLGTKLFAIAFAAFVATAAFQLLRGGILGMFGKANKDSGQTNEGHSIMVTVAVTVLMFVGSLFFIALMINSI